MIDNFLDASNAQDGIKDAALPSYFQGAESDAGPFSVVKFLNTNLSYAASADSTRWYMSNCIDDVLYVVKEYKEELCESLDRIDVRAARVVVSRYETLREPLLGLGILQVPIEKRKS